MIYNTRFLYFCSLQSGILLNGTLVYFNVVIYTEMLFNHLSLRTGKKATVITTNLPFTRWEEVLKDKVLCSALVDRLCHKSYLVNMTGTSYRIKETKKFLEQK